MYVNHYTGFACSWPGVLFIVSYNSALYTNVYGSYMLFLSLSCISSYVLLMKFIKFSNKPCSFTCLWPLAPDNTFTVCYLVKASCNVRFPHCLYFTLHSALTSHTADTQCQCTFIRYNIYIYMHVCTEDWCPYKPLALVSLQMLTMVLLLVNLHVNHVPRGPWSSHRILHF